MLRLVTDGFFTDLRFFLEFYLANVEAAIHFELNGELRNFHSSRDQTGANLIVPICSKVTRC